MSEQEMFRGKRRFWWVIILSGATSYTLLTTQFDVRPIYDDAVCVSYNFYTATEKGREIYGH